MPKSPVVDLDCLFSGAEKVHQLSQAEAEILHLREEIERLRSSGSDQLETQLTTLREQLQSQSGFLSVPIASIQANPSQPRQTFLNESIEAMAKSLEREGQLQPIILIEQEGDYLLFDGERRWRGAKLLGWENLQSVVISRPVALHRQSLLTSLHREDLNPLDKAEAILREIAQISQLPPTEIPRLLAAATRRLTKQGKLTELSQCVISNEEQQRQTLVKLQLSDAEQSVISELLQLQLNPASVDANLFPMLNLEPDLKEAIRERGLKGSQAIALQQLSPKNLRLDEREALKIRISATGRVIEEKRSVAQTRKLVRQIKQGQEKNAPGADPTPRPIASATRGIKQLSMQVLNELNTSQLGELQQILRQKLTEISEVLQQK